ERRLPFVSGKYRKGTGPFTKKSPAYGFRELLAATLSNVGMRRGLKGVSAARNALIHSGGLHLGRRTKDRAYDKAQRLAREYFLRQLGYKGRFVEFGSGKFRTLR